MRTKDLVSGAQTKRARGVHAGIKNQTIPTVDSRAVREEMRAQATRLLALAGDLPSFSWHISGHEPAPHHRIIFDLLADQRNKEIAIICPPDHGKTVCITSYMLWEIARDPGISIAYISNTDGQANKVSLDLRDRITDNERFRELVKGDSGGVYRPVHPGKKWSEGEWTVERPIFKKDPTFAGYGEGGNILGARITHMVMDDLNNMKNTATAELKKKTNHWIKSEVLSRVEKKVVREGDVRDHTAKGRVIYITTRWADDDGLSVIMQRFPGIKIVHMPSLGYWSLLVERTLGITSRGGVVARFPGWVDNYTPTFMGGREVICLINSFRQIVLGSGVKAFSSLLEHYSVKKEPIANFLNPLESTCGGNGLDTFSKTLVKPEVIFQNVMLSPEERAFCREKVDFMSEEMVSKIYATSEIQNPNVYALVRPLIRGYTDM